jgi:hypothetical protein
MGEHDYDGQRMGLPSDGGRLILLPGACSECGCTEDAACSLYDEYGKHACHWVDAARTLCSGCG